MRVSIWVDMEGIAGIQAWEQVVHDGAMYQEGRRLMTAEVNAAVRGAYAYGANEIVVIDCHGAGGAYSFKSLIPEMLDPHSEYVLGAKWMRYTQVLEDGCDAALLVGAHAMAGTPDGVLCHTVSSEAWYNAWINNDLVGESGICAAVCGTWNCPVAFVSGDVATCNEVQKLLGSQVTIAPVKVGINRFAARNLAPQAACELIETRVKESLQNLSRLKPYIPSSPTTFKVMLATPDRATDFRGKPGVEISDNDRLVISRGANFWQAWDQFWYQK
ncbi:MAG TPA: M55 family metallopeptidase [Anaerolineae bacterium]|nr:M55 family metallopeptidase [Anaerolineae bacterium]